MIAIKALYFQLISFFAFIIKENITVNNYEATLLSLDMLRRRYELKKMC